MSKFPKQESNIDLPELKDNEGNTFSSVLDDIPATDNLTSKKITKLKPNYKTDDSHSNNKQQIIVFISSSDQSALKGNDIKKALIEHNLVFGEKNIYHYMYSDSIDNKPFSLFRVASGIKPWTLKDEDLDNKEIAGLSLVMLLPTKTDEISAKTVFYSTAKQLASTLNAVLKDEKQNILTQENLALLK